jgi:hypothetical protein
VTRNEDGVLVNLSQLERVAKQGGQKPAKVEPKFREGDSIQFKGFGHNRYTIKEVCGLSHYINTKGNNMDMSYTDANFEVVKDSDKVKLSHACSEKYIADVFEKVGLAKIVREQSNDNLTNALQDAMIELSKFIPQPKQEWSKEDEAFYQRLEQIVCKVDFEAFQGDIDLHSWLKSLRPQNSWKPSMAQLNALSIVSKGNITDDIEAIVSLYQDLKKLREE